MTEKELKNKIVETLLSDKITGSNKVSVDTLLNHAVSDSEQGKARKLLRDEMVPQNEGSVVKIGGGARENVQLGDIKRAVRYLYENGGEVPWGFQDLIEDDWDRSDDDH